MPISHLSFHTSCRVGSRVVQVRQFEMNTAVVRDFTGTVLAECLGNITDAQTLLFHSVICGLIDSLMGCKRTGVRKRNTCPARFLLIQ